MLWTSVLCTLVFIVAIVKQTSGAERSFYTAAVLEHAVILPPTTSLPVSRQTAVGNMGKNLAIFQLQAKAAKQQGADIIVFPEDGVYGYNFTRDTIYPYLEPIPDPDCVSSLPCDEPDRTPGTEVQRALSCMAKTNAIYLVANMGDVQPCDSKLDKKCPEDGRFQYNTAVAYGPDGSLLAKYHKTNLYKEMQFNYPQPKVRYFNTPFGKFGLVICFDLLFREPLIPMVKDHLVTNIVFPTAWMDSLPLLSAVGYHSSVAMGLNINLLSANLHIPKRRFQGSGIYTPNGMASFYYNNTPGSGPRLLVSRVQIINATSKDNGQRACHSELEEATPYHISIETKHPTDGPSLIQTLQPRNYLLSKHVLEPRTSNTFLSLYPDLYQRFRKNSSTANLLLEFEHQNFTFVPLTTNSSTAHTCRSDICCYLGYEMFSTGTRSELFALGAFDGVFHNKYCLQVCTVLRCAGTDPASCGSTTADSWSTFSTLNLTGSFRTNFIYPQLVLSRNGQLELAPAEKWTFRNNTLTISQNIDTPILSATLLGRVFSLDP